MLDWASLCRTKFDFANTLTASHASRLGLGRWKTMRHSRETDQGETLRARGLAGTMPLLVGR